MTNDNNKNNKLVSEQEDDPTVELEPLSEGVCEENAPGQQVEAESDAITFDITEPGFEVDDVDETIAILQFDLHSRADTISKLQIDNEQLRSRWTGLEKELVVREEITKTLTTDLKIAQRNYSKTHSLLNMREKEIESLTLKLSGHKQTLQESARQTEQATKSERESEAQVREMQAQLNVAEKKLAAMTKESTVRSADGGIEFEDLSDKLASLRADKDRQSLAGKDFEINELSNQIARTETYADELRRQLQDQLALTVALQTRQKHLEVSLTSANGQVGELSDRIEESRADNAMLREKTSGLKEGLDREVRQIRVELGEAQGTIADRDSLNQQLTSDLVDARESNMNLEKRLCSTEDKNKAVITKLERKLADVEILNEELQHKLLTKDSAISALLDELTKRSDVIESIDEVDDVADEMEDDVTDEMEDGKSETIDDRDNLERGRVTRLLIGKIDGQELRFPLFRNRLTIGRTGHNDIQLKAPYISRRHAVIVTDDDSTRIIDWGSKNGVFVNTAQIKEKILRNGDIVTIGTADFKFEERRKR